MKPRPCHLPGIRLLPIIMAGATGVSGAEKIEARSYSTRPDPDPPAYVRPQAVDPAGKVDFGLDYRWRFEARDDDLRRSEAGMDTPQLHRMRVYFGLKEVLDPLRFAFEMQDSRKSDGVYPDDGRDVNEAEVIRGYVELRGPGGTGLRYGINNFEFLDLRLICNNQWLNTENTF
ncbi:MAG: alginate export family protein [Verrucomicrobiota bacterium]